MRIYLRQPILNDEAAFLAAAVSSKHYIGATMSAGRCLLRSSMKRRDIAKVSGPQRVFNVIRELEPTLLERLAHANACTAE